MKRFCTMLNTLEQYCLKFGLLLYPCELRTSETSTIPLLYAAISLSANQRNERLVLLADFVKFRFIITASNLLRTALSSLWRSCHQDWHIKMQKIYIYFVDEDQRTHWNFKLISIVCLNMSSRKQHLNNMFSSFGHQDILRRHGSLPIFRYSFVHARKF